MANRLTYLRGLCAFAVIFILSIHSALALTRQYASDDELVQRSESIVIGHTIGPFELVKHPMTHNSFQTWEHQVTLVITEVLKGNIHTGKTRVIIHYGIDPVVLNESNPEQFNLIHAELNHDPKAAIAIQDSSQFGGPVSADITKDQIWFLRTANPTAPYSYDGEEKPEMPGIWHPQDVQPSELKAYFQALLSNNPEAALNSFTVGDSPLAQRALDAQRCLAIIRISKIPDPAVRVDQLIPYYLIETPPGGEAAYIKAYLQIIATGTVGAAKLVPVFQNPKYPRRRGEIISAWEQTHYREAAPVVIAWLKQEDQMWASRDLHDKGWADPGRDHSHDPASNLRASYDDMASGIGLLQDFHAVEGKDVIEQIKRRWAGVDPPELEQHLTKICDNALASFQ